jgi:hypothetical protein
MLEEGYRECPPGWTKPPRQQLDAVTRDQRYTITWDVSQSELEEALSSQGYTGMDSPAVYAAGSGWHLILSVKKAEGSKPRGIGVYFANTSYECQEEEVAPENEVTQANYTITHQPPGAGSRRTLSKGSPTLFRTVGWGVPTNFQASSMSDMLPHLRDGYLKLEATFQVIH